MATSVKYYIKKMICNTLFIIIESLPHLILIEIMFLFTIKK